MEHIEGYVDHIIYRNQDNGYTVMNVVADGEEITCVGMLHYIGDGELVEISGHYKEHATYGHQLHIETLKIKAPEDELYIERYLGSGAVKGIGVSLAARIVRKFHEDTFRIMEEEPERLAEVKGISEKKAREIALARGYRGLYTQAQDNNLTACLFYLSQGFFIGGLDTQVYMGTRQEGKSDIIFYLDC